MEMESSRRSAPVDRSRELGWKKPRLAEEAERDCASNVLDRPLPAPRVSGGGRPTDPRIRPERDRERNEREDLGRGGSYQQQHLQELVAQYRTALAELTFNSKPIITNLTIIAGENLHAAKAIAATICANILEVPSEQKLPSLYLLDSIVKNIGRDYVKYFSARLPEVFCKAYKQVDSCIHPGMRHLFGTWKGVFPLAPLQMIEKELGFPPTANGSSGSTALKLDSQTQRPSHSIHVNPKYLEARQRLQQSTRAKEVSNDDINNTRSPASNNAERSDRSVTVGSARPWTDPMKMPNIQRPLREQLSDPEKKGYREYEFSTDLSGHSELGVGRVDERIKEPDRAAKPWYGASSAASESPANRGNGFDVNLVYGNCREPGLVQANRQIPPVHLNGGNNSSRQVPTSWKNSEEEEYMWDDVNSRLTDCGGTSDTVKGGWNNDDADRAASFARGKLLPMKHQDSRWTKLDTYSEPKNSSREDRVPFFMEVEENLTQPHQQGALTFTDLVSTRQTEPGDHTSPVWPPHKPLTSVVALNHTSSAISALSEGEPISFSSALATSITTSLPVTGLLSHSIPSSLGSLTSAVSVLRGSLEQQVPQPLQPPSPSAQLPSSSASLLLPKSHISTNYDNLQSHSPSQMGQKPLQPAVQLNQCRHASVNQDSTPSFSHDQSQQSHSSLNSQQHKHLQNSPASSAPFNQTKHQLPFLRQPDPDLFEEQPLSQSQLSSQTQNPPLAHCVGSHQTGGIYGTGKSKNPAVDVLGQSNAGNLVVDILKSGVVPNNSTHNQNIHPPLPSGPPPIHALTSSVPSITLSSSLVSLPTSLGSVSSMPPPIRSVPPPLPPGPPPSSSILGTALQVSNMSNATPSPLSSLLSSLVAKGLITPSTELPSSTSAGRPTIPSGGSSEFCGSNAEVQVSSTSASLSMSPPSLVQELSLPNATTDVTLTESTCTAMKDLIGIDFRPDIVREFHPSVINSLVDDLKHQCNKCGMRFKFERQLQSHLDWHATNNSREGSFGKMSRKWFVETDNWIARSVGATNGLLSSNHIEGVSPTGGKWEPMVPADESQCICALCGEPFEDFYSVERDRWMYKGTVYLKLPDKKDDTISMDRSKGLVPILHAKCISRSSGDLEVAENNEVDWKGS